MPTDGEDKEIEYGKWNTYTAEGALLEQKELERLAPSDDIWPHWSEGVPRKLRRKVGSPPFVSGKVRHEYREYYETIDLDWSWARSLSTLSSNYRLLPAVGRESEWSGVYRIFALDTAINRLCGQDATGTLYLGMAGAGDRRWSILRTRIMSVAKQEHHATKPWRYNKLLQQKFPWEALFIEWAYTRRRNNYKGEAIAMAPLAESWLLSSYCDSFGELPPLNLRR